MSRLLTAAFITLICAPGLHAQSADADTRAAIAVTDSVLAALSSGDNVTLKRLTLDSAIVGGAGVRIGSTRLDHPRREVDGLPLA